MLETNTVAELNIVADLQSQLAAKKKTLREAQERQAWEAKTAARNPAYVVGSLRRPSPTDAAQLAHVHGWVCTIACEACGQERVINKQDAKQVRFCKACRKEASKAAAKAKRLTKKLGNVNVDDLKAQLAELDEQLSDLS
jgi:hypothetical protein